MINLSIVFPLYNDATSLSLFLPQAFSFLEKIKNKNEIIIIDDGSIENSRAILADAFKKTPSNVTCKLLKFSRNFGKEAALSAGLEKAQGQYIAFMDADGQHPISVLEEMYNIHLNNKVDMVAAVQASRGHESYILKNYKKGFYRFIQDSKKYQIKPNAGDFRVMNRKVANALLMLPERQRFMKGLYAWVGFKTYYLPYQAEKRVDGVSKFNYSSLFELATIGITSFSLKPLRWISRTGIIVSIISILYGIYIILDTIFNGTDIRGWPTLAVGIMFSTGIQLIFLGIIGEYIGRIYEEIKQRPLYIIDEAIEINSNEKDNSQH